MSDFADEDAGWLKQCFTAQLDVEKLQEEIKQSKMKKELKDKLEMLIDILFCNERIIYYKTSVNYFLEKLIDPCPNCKKYMFRIESATPKQGTSYYVTKFICESCRTHAVEIIVPYKLIAAYCDFYSLPHPEDGKDFQGNISRGV